MYSGVEKTCRAARLGLDRYNSPRVVCQRCSVVSQCPQCRKYFTSQPSGTSIRPFKGRTFTWWPVFLGSELQFCKVLDCVFILCKADVTVPFIVCLNGLNQGCNHLYLCCSEIRARWLSSIYITRGINLRVGRFIVLCETRIQSFGM